MFASRVVLSFLLIPAASLAIACGGGADGPLDKDGVTGLPTGSGTGAAASGSYQAELRTLGCSGTCPTGSCREGSVASGTLSLVQRDGYLSMTAAGALLEGGIDADGAYLVGGWTTIQSGAVQQAFRSDGVYTGNGFSGAIEARRWGTLEGQAVDCTESGTITATRAATAQ